MPDLNVGVTPNKPVFTPTVLDLAVCRRGLSQAKRRGLSLNVAA
jgi:hypothetical protein